MSYDSAVDQIIYNRSKIRPFISKCQTERTALLYVGDSNHNMNSMGYVSGIGLALARRFGQWGIFAFSASYPAGAIP